MLEVEFVVAGYAGGFAAELPEDGTGQAADFVDGFGVPRGDYEVSCIGFVDGIDMAVLVMDLASVNSLGSD